MNDDQITALAREYAEWVTQQEDDKAYIPAEQAIASAFLRWLTRRFCLVEKERLKRVMKLHGDQVRNSNEGGEVWFFHKGSENALGNLFPEIAKEVEG